MHYLVIVVVLDNPLASTRHFTALAKRNMQLTLITSHELHSVVHRHADGDAYDHRDPNYSIRASRASSVSHTVSETLSGT